MCEKTAPSVGSRANTALGFALCCTVEPVHYGHLGTNKKCPDCSDVLIFQVILYDNAPFWTKTKCMDYAGVLIFKCPN